MKEKDFPNKWKLTNVVPVHKREEKLLKSCHPISLLPIFRDIFERIIHNYLFNHFVSSKLFTPLQFRFPPGNSCIPQLLSIIHQIQTKIGTNFRVDVRGMLLGISKLLIKFGIEVFYSYSILILFLLSILHSMSIKVFIILFYFYFYGVEGKLLSL